MENKLPKPYVTNYNFSIAHDLGQTQILLIILPTKFIKLNANIDMMKKCETCGIVSAILNARMLKMI